MGVGDKEAKKQAKTLRGGIDEADTKAPAEKAFDPLRPVDTALKGLKRAWHEHWNPTAPPAPPAPPPAADLTDEMLRKRAVAELLQQKTKRGLSSTFVKKPTGKGLLGE